MSNLVLNNWESTFRVVNVNHFSLWKLNIIASMLYWTSSPKCVRNIIKPNEHHFCNSCDVKRLERWYDKYMKMLRTGSAMFSNVFCNLKPFLTCHEVYVVYVNLSPNTKYALNNLRAWQSFQDQTCTIRKFNIFWKE